MTRIRACRPDAARSDLAEDIRRGLVAGAAVLVIVLPPADRSGRSGFPPAISMSIPAPAAATGHRRGDFGAYTPSPDARHVADWIAASRDNANSDFVIVDKKDTRLYVFDANARLRGSTPVLLGAALGDDSVPGIGARAIADVNPHERTTPAGRFVAERGRNSLGEDVVWVDHDAAISMHRVRTTNPMERRLERLATPSIDDNRISYGCINVPADFYEAYIDPIFAMRRAIVYILPEVKPVRQVLGSYDVAAAR
jgi:hypothetical protein